MTLNSEDVKLFFSLHSALMCYVNKRLKIIPRKPSTMEEWLGMQASDRLPVHNALNTHLELIDSFVEDNPNHFSEEELDIARSWRNLIHGKFIMVLELSNYMVFLSTTTPAVAYGVRALWLPFRDVIAGRLPAVVDTVLLPFKGTIVYDGVMSDYSVSFGDGIRRSFRESLREARARHGIVTSLPMSPEPVPDKPTKNKPAPKSPRT